MTKGSVSSQILIVAALLSVSPLASAQLARVGGEFPINSHSFGDQNFPHVSGLSDGSFVVVWDSIGQDGDESGVFGRLFGPDGQPVTSDFQVNSTSIGSQGGARVATASDGTFLIVWASDPQRQIMARRFDAVSRSITEEFPVSGDAFRFVFSPDVTVNKSGEFVVVWAYSATLSDLVQAQALDRNARLKGSSFAVSSAAVISGHSQTTIASGREESFMVVWYDDVGIAVDGRAFGRPAEPSSPEFVVASDVVKGFALPAICSQEDGDFAVVWKGYRTQESWTESILFRRYDEGNSQTAESVVFAADSRSQNPTSPTIACGRDKETVIAWTEPSGLRGRYFVEDPPNEFSEFRIKAHSGRGLGHPSLAMLGSGEFVVTWGECEFSSDCDLFGQRFALGVSSDCTGDCSGDRVVTVDELVVGVSIALGSTSIPLRECLPADPDLSYTVTVDEVVTAVDSALRGCR